VDNSDKQPVCPGFAGGVLMSVFRLFLVPVDSFQQLSVEYFLKQVQFSPSRLVAIG
jgi:hypothetical protein